MYSVFMKISAILLLGTFAHAQKQIIIDLSTQKLYAKEDGKTFLSSSISSGRYGHETPIGKYKVILKDAKHKSNVYPKRTMGEWINPGGAPMPYTVKFKYSGEAIHAGTLPGYPDSHGCVRIPYKKAKKLFSWVKINTEVKVIGKPNYQDKKNKHRKKVSKFHSTGKWVDDGRMDNWGMDEQRMSEDSDEGINAYFSQGEEQ